MHSVDKLSLQPSDTIQQCTSVEVTAKASAQQDAVMSKDGMLHVTCRGFIVLVC